MYAQFFGNFLLSHELITTEQLVEAMERKNEHRLRFGTLAMHAGYLSASEVEHIRIIQTHRNLKFGEIAIEIGLLTEEQVDELLAQQQPDYLAFGQALIDMGIIDNHEWERLVVDYISETEINDLDYYDESREKVEDFFFNVIEEKQNNNEPVSNFKIDYCTLLFNNLIRFIGDDFTPVKGINYSEYPTEFCVSQEVQGRYPSRYVGETFTEFDEYVEASIMDFINLHNGLFCVNESSSNNVELSLTPPQVETEPLLIFETPTSVMTVLFPFGSINFIFEIKN